MYYYIGASDLIALEWLQARFMSIDERPSCYVYCITSRRDVIFALDPVLAVMGVWWFLAHV